MQEARLASAGRAGAPAGSGVRLTRASRYPGSRGRSPGASRRPLQRTDTSSSRADRGSAGRRIASTAPGAADPVEGHRSASTPSSICTRQPRPGASVSSKFPTASGVNDLARRRPRGGRELGPRAAAAKEQPLRPEARGRLLIDARRDRFVGRRSARRGTRKWGGCPERIRANRGRRGLQLRTRAATARGRGPRFGAGPGAEEPRGAPDVFGVQDVTEVQVAPSERARIGFSLQWAPMVCQPGPDPTSVSRVTDLPSLPIAEL